MYVLVEYNDFYNQIIDEIKKYKYTPIVLFKLTLNNKNQIKIDYQKILELKSKINPKYSAIQVNLERIENSTVGTINNLKNNFDIIIGFGGLNKVNRFFLESTQIDFLLDPQNSKVLPKIDFLHHFNSGINHILCNFAKDRQIGFIFSLNFFNNSKRYIPKEIGRINQNLRFTRKYKIQTSINFIIQNPTQIKSIEQLSSIISIFDTSTIQKNDSFKVLENKINQNKLEKSPKYINEGIEILN